MQHYNIQSSQTQVIIHMTKLPSCVLQKMYATVWDSLQHQSWIISTECI